MSKVVVLGVEGEDGFWLADFEAGTLTKIDDTADGAFAFAARSRQSGEPLVRGVKFAIVTNNGEDPAGGHVDRGLSRKPLIQGLDYAVAADNGDDVAGGLFDRGLYGKPVVNGVDVALVVGNGDDVAGGHYDHGRTAHAATKGVDVAVMVDTGEHLSSGHFDRGPVLHGIDVAIMANNSNASGGFMDRGPE